MKNRMSVISENWDQLTSEKKRQLSFNQLVYSAKDIKFISSEAEQHYQLKLKRLIDVFNVREPDRVPVSVVPGVIPLYRDGIDYNTAIHDPQRALTASLKFNAEYSRILDTFSFPFLIPATAL